MRLSSHSLTGLLVRGIKQGCTKQSEDNMKKILYVYIHFELNNKTQSNWPEVSGSAFSSASILQTSTTTQLLGTVHNFMISKQQITIK